MEDVLETYALPYDENIPLICMDEQPVQLLGDVYKALTMKRGRIIREDYEYERRGTCSIFMFTEPLKGWRHVSVRSRRTKKDWAEQVKELLDVYYPEAAKIRLVMDNLNTRDISSLYETYPPAEALRLAKRLEIHHTPKHGSWLNIAEIELSAMTIQCLNRRITTKEILAQEVAAWEQSRNAAAKNVDWHFSTSTARGKLKWLYTKI
jgi:hypothetical protein